MGSRASTLDTRHAAADDNWKKLQDEENRKKKREAEKARIKKEREKAQRFVKLEGKGLGESDEETEDTRMWLKSQHKRQKKIDKERRKLQEAELAELDRRQQYTEKDLAGLKVAHELGDFQDEEEQILTLKDAAVDADESDDELENAGVRERERIAENQKLKKKRPVYDPNEHAEEGEHSILAQYDEEIDGKKKKRFTLDGQGKTLEASSDVKRLGAISSSQGVKISLDEFLKEKPVSDYLDVSEIKIKKPKKKKEKSKRQKLDDEAIFPSDLNGGTNDAMEVEPNQTNGTTTQKRTYESFADDDDLQSSLAAQRFATLKKRKRQRPEDLVRELREQSANEMDTVEDEEGGLILDDTALFVSNLQKPEAPSSRVAMDLKKEASGSPSTSPEPEDIEMPDIKREDSTDIKLEAIPVASSSMTTTGLEEESGLDRGMGNVASMLRQRGILQGGKGGDQNTSSVSQDRFRYHRKQLLEQFEEHAKRKREEDRRHGVFEGMSNREKEEYAKRENEKREQYVSRELAKLMEREYKPNVEIKHIDEHGRQLTEKEAFKHLSHQFHGKGSGKQKMEKHLKRVEDEKKKEAKSSLDAGSTGMNNAMGMTARKNRQAGVRLQ